MEPYLKIARTFAIGLMCLCAVLHLLTFVPGIGYVDVAAFLLLIISVPAAMGIALATYAYAHAVYLPSQARMDKMQGELYRMSLFRYLASGNNAKEIFHARIKRLIPQRVRDIFFLVTVYCVLSSIGWIAYAAVTTPPKYLADHRPQHLREPIDDSELQRRKPYVTRVMTNVSAVAVFSSWIFGTIVCPKLARIKARRQRFALVLFPHLYPVIRV